MNVSGHHYRTIWVNQADHRCINVIDQRSLPHRFLLEELRSVHDVEVAIRDMHVRGAGLIGAAAGYGMYLATLELQDESAYFSQLEKSAATLLDTRPTAKNLAWAVHVQLDALRSASTKEELVALAFKTANEIADLDAASCYQIGEHGAALIVQISQRKRGDVVNILTHCNAGWLAFVDFGTALAPIYAAHEKGIDVHVWVDETRPRNQGASLTAWELGQQGVPHTIISDNVGGHLMQHGMVDMVIVGSDRTTATGDVANKVGTYLKALAAFDNNIPCYVALPSSTIDWELSNGLTEIPIEERSGDEVKYVEGMSDGEIKRILITPENSPAMNYAFDVTPARLITALITERGMCAASREGLLTLYPEHQR